jgi:hypothetical protein
MYLSLKFFVLGIGPPWGLVDVMPYFVGRGQFHIDTAAVVQFPTPREGTALPTRVKYTRNTRLDSNYKQPG